MRPWNTWTSRWLRGLLVTIACLCGVGCHTASDISPNPAAPGASITISGAGFGTTQGTSQVVYDGVVVSVVSWSNTQIVATVPSPKANGTYNVSIVVQGQAVTKPHTVRNPLTLSATARYLGHAEAGPELYEVRVWPGTTTGGYGFFYRSQDGADCIFINANCELTMIGAEFWLDQCFAGEWYTWSKPPEQIAPCDPFTSPWGQPHENLGMGTLEGGAAAAGHVTEFDSFGVATHIEGRDALTGDPWWACQDTLGPCG